MAPPGTNNSIADTLSRLGREHPDQRLSASFSPNAAITTLITNLAGKSTGTMEKIHALATRVKQYLFVHDTDRTIRSVSCLTPSSDVNNKSVMLGVLNDDLQDTQFVYFDNLQRMDAVVAGLVLPEVAVMYDLPLSTQAMDTAEGPTGSDAPSIQRLGFDATYGVPDNAPAPVMALLPLLFPLPPGISLPSETLQLDSPNPDLEQACPFYEVWRTVMHYLYNANHGMSVHYPGGLFDTGKLEMGFAKGYHLVENASPSIETLPPFGTAITNIKHVFDEVRNAAWQRLGEVSPQARNLPSPNANGGGGANTNNSNLLTEEFGSAIGKAIADHSKSAPVSAKDKDQADFVKQTTAVYKLLTAYIVTDPDTGTKTVVYGKLSDDFKAVLETQSQARANKKLRDMVFHHIRSLTTGANVTNIYNDAVTFDPDVLLAACGTALRLFQVHLDSINVDSSNCKTKLSILAFSTPRGESVTFRKVILDGKNEVQQELLGDDASKRDKKSSEICVDGAIVGAVHIKSMLCNTRAVFGACVETFDKSFLWTACKEGFLLMNTSEGRKYCQRYQDVSQVYLHMATAFHNIFRQYATIATMPEYIRAVLDDRPLDPKIFTNAAHVCSQFLDVFRSEFNAQEVTQFKSLPNVAVLFGYLNPSGASNASSDGVAKKGNDSQGTNGRTANASDDKNREKGFLVWKGKGRLVALPMFYENKQGNNRVCSYFVFRGFVCNRGKDCRQHHPPSFSAMPKDAQQVCKKHVDVTDGIEFVPGHGPSGKP